MRLALGHSKRDAAAQRGEEDGMREPLSQLTHQFSLALALPLAVTAVWIVRGDPAGVHATQTATAYRAELADLPLPTPLRLRAPREASDRLGVHRQPEDPIARRRRAVLPDLAAPQPVGIAVAAGSGPDGGVAPSPRDRQPQLTNARALAARDALPLLSAPLIVASRAAAIREPRIDAAENAAGAAVDAPDSNPDAEVAAGAATVSKKARVAPGDSDSVRAADGAPVVKTAAEAGVPARIPVKPSSETVAAPAARSPLHEKSSGPMASSPLSSNARSSSHSSRNTRATSSSRGGESVSKQESAAELHETPKRGAGQNGTEKSAPEALATALPSPVPAYTTHAASKPLDLSIERDEGNDSLLDSVLPATPTTSLSAPWPAPADWMADTPARFDATAPDTRPDLAWVSPEVFSGSMEVEDEAAFPTAFSNSGLFSPIFTLLAIPEPGSAVLLSAALAGLAAVRRRGRRG